MWILSRTFLVAAVFMPGVRSQTHVWNNLEVGARETLTITLARVGNWSNRAAGSNTDSTDGFILCPNGNSECKFAPNSSVAVRSGIVEAQAGRESLAIGLHGLHIPKLNISSGVRVSMISSAGPQHSSRPWTFDTIALFGGEILLRGKTTAVTASTLLCYSMRQGMAKDMASRSMTQWQLSPFNSSSIVIESGAKLTITHYAVIPSNTFVHIHCAPSLLHFRHGLSIERNSVFIWTLGGSVDLNTRPRIAGEIFVEGNVLVKGGGAIVHRDADSFDIKPDGSYLSVSPLMSAVAFSGKFDRVFLGPALQCAAAHASESWVSFALSLDLWCLSQCSAAAAVSSCPSRGHLKSPSSFPEIHIGNDATGGDPIGEEHTTIPFILGICISVGIVVTVVVSRYLLKRDLSSKNVNDSHPGIVRPSLDHFVLHSLGHDQKEEEEADSVGLLAIEIDHE